MLETKIRLKTSHSFINGLAQFPSSPQPPIEPRINSDVHQTSRRLVGSAQAR